jgi:REP element-mobilizing transposase RayT
MARKLRVQYPGAIYHLMTRGDRREDIFTDDHDRHKFLETLGEACAKTGWLVHAYCLMSNHFHLVAETPSANLVEGMKWFLGTYTGRFNRRHKLSGHLFSGRYKALIVDGGGNGYLKTVCDYAHLNPARAQLLSPDVPLREYRWSSWPEYLLPRAERPPWLRVEKLLGEWGIPKDNPSGRRELETGLERRRAGERGMDYRKLRRGWCFGPDTFKRELLEQLRHGVGKEHYGPERRESAESHAEAVVVEELRLRGWSVIDLERRAKGDAEKVAIARRLRAETTVPVSWIAARLRMGATGYVNNLLYRSRLRPGGSM